VNEISRGLLPRLGAWWFRPAPSLRLATVRVMVSAYALIWLLAAAPLLYGNIDFPADHFEPVGIVAMLEAPLPAWGVVGAWLLALLSGFAVLVGFGYRIAAPCFAIALLWVASYRSSWGMIFHTENLLVLHVLVLALLPAADSWALDAHTSNRHRVHERYGWGLKLMATLVVISYTLAAVAKLRNAGWLWLDGDVLANQVAWDNLRKLELGDLHSPLGVWLMGHAWVFAPLAWASLALELGAPLALLGKRVARFWVLGIWGFHLGVLLVMAIGFFYPLSGIAFASFFAVERPLQVFSLRVRQRWPGGSLSRLLPEPKIPMARRAV